MLKITLTHSYDIDLFSSIGCLFVCGGSLTSCSFRALSRLEHRMNEEMIVVQVQPCFVQGGIITCATQLAGHRQWSEPVFTSFTA